MTKSQLTELTLTGADDSVNPADLVNASNTELGERLEWGFLVSQSQEGSSRFPKISHLRSMLDALDDINVSTSLHVCGSYVRSILKGDWSPLISALGRDTLDRFSRVQLNFHADRHEVQEAFFAETRAIQNAYWLDLILQFDGVNDALFKRCQDFGINTFALFDLSGGRGKLPMYWPTNTAPLTEKVGYAGGLGPKNLSEQLPIIRRAANGGRFWIDMESKLFCVREDDIVFDLERCAEVIRIVEQSEHATP